MTRKASRSFDVERQATELLKTWVADIATVNCFRRELSRRIEEKDSMADNFNEFMDRIKRAEEVARVAKKYAGNQDAPSYLKEQVRAAHGDTDRFAVGGSDMLKRDPESDTIVTLTLMKGMEPGCYVPADYRAWTGKCTLQVYGWDHDNREICEIPEAVKVIRDYIRTDAGFPALLSPDPIFGPAYPSPLLMLGYMTCSGKPKDYKGRQFAGGLTVPGVGSFTVVTDWHEYVHDFLIPASSTLVEKVDEPFAEKWLKMAALKIKERTRRA